MRPRILVDISGGRDLKRIGRTKKRINLDYHSFISLPLKAALKTTLIITIGLIFILGLVAAPRDGDSLVLYTSKAAQSSADEQRKALEDQLAQLEKQIADHEANIEKYKKQGKSLQSEIKNLENQIAKLNLQIKAINLSLLQLDGEIKNTEVQIQQTEDNISANKSNLSQILQTLYERDNENLVEVLFKHPELSDFFADLNNLIAVQDNLRIFLDRIVESRQRLLDEKETLALERTDAESLKEYQSAQKAGIQKTQEAKLSFLKITKGKESEYQKLLADTKKTAAEVRKQIFQLLGGGELQFDDAYKLAKFAEQATGVRAALILAVLDRESALGRNVGQCDYRTAMHPTRDTPIFLTLVKELDLQKNLDSGLLKVSCANSDGAYGGAMGPAQFLPSVWNLYKDQVSSITGNNPASPWRNEDAFVATALYLKDAGAANTSLSGERQAAAKYYAGARWRNYVWTYGARVIAQAQKFQDDIDVLNS